MSVRAPTTSDLLLARYQPGVGDLILKSLDPSDLRTLENVSRAFRLRVQQYYRNQYVVYPNIMDVFASQERSPLESKHTYNKHRAVSLVNRTKRLYAGTMVVHRARNFRDASVFHPVSQSYLANFRWNCKVVGLLPFLQKIDAADEMLKEIATLRSDRDKYWAMKRWVLEHPQQAASLVHLSIDGYCARNLNGFTNPMQEGEKIYIFLPDEIGCFTELRRLSLNYNGLVEIPQALGRTKIEILEARGNFFQEMPPPIPTLRALYLTQNHHLFTSQQMNVFIREYLANGGGSLKIYLDGEYYENFKNENFIPGIGTHEVIVELKQGETVLSVSKILEQTQPLTQPSELP